MDVINIPHEQKSSIVSGPEECTARNETADVRRTANKNLCSQGVLLQIVEMSANSLTSNYSTIVWAHNVSTPFLVCSIIDTTFFATRSVLLFPLTVLILYLAYQRWRQQGSWTAVSHCDLFTYHLADMELFDILGTVSLLCGLLTGFKDIVRVSRYLYSIPITGEFFFHNLTCVERYLAVVHPHTYIGLRSARGVRIRNTIIGCVWLLSFAWMLKISLHYPLYPIVPSLVIFTLSLVIISFCGLSVLCVLSRPGPGQKVQDKEGVDQSKRRAFYTIMAITGVLFLWFSGIMVGIAVRTSVQLKGGETVIFC
ncbi:hypothetical protein L3Q82_003768 [Xyrichtys novacula]|uniref:G-protein coupled receptors family 1 profile domain-containing protein n=1 Tax=Xyrichtys novacula TaxID=13765 RepID=A0AAV1EHP3_XYRNO|nr:hypothetical protein L3Q82_003768 [Xyrichtys novacula]